MTQEQFEVERLRREQLAVRTVAALEKQAEQLEHIANMLGLLIDGERTIGVNIIDGWRR